MPRGAMILLLAMALGATARAEEFLPWDGRAVTDLAERLRDEVEAAARAADTSMPQSSLAQHAMRSRARDRLGRLSEAVEPLVIQLLQVQGPDRTKPAFDLVLERAEPVRRFMEEEKPTRKLRALWADADETLRHLARFYGMGDAAAGTPGGP